MSLPLHRFPLFVSFARQTLAATPTSPPSVVTASIGGPDVQQGPVGQPAPTLQQAPSTVYTYTTTDANGNLT